MHHRVSCLTLSYNVIQCHSVIQWLTVESDLTTTFIGACVHTVTCTHAIHLPLKHFNLLSPPPPPPPSFQMPFPLPWSLNSTPCQVFLPSYTSPPNVLSTLLLHRIPIPLHCPVSLLPTPPPTHSRLFLPSPCTYVCSHFDDTIGILLN